jgi:hypothetical protein
MSREATKKQKGNAEGKRDQGRQVIDGGRGLNLIVFFGLLVVRNGHKVDHWHQRHHLSCECMCVCKDTKS